MEQHAGQFEAMLKRSSNSSSHCDSVVIIVVSAILEIPCYYRLTALSSTCVLLLFADEIHKGKKKSDQISCLLLSSAPPSSLPPFLSP